MMWTPLVPFFPLITLSLTYKNINFVPATVIPDMGMTDMLPKLVAICFSSPAETPNPPLVAHTFPSWPQIAAWDTI